jgi:hypothetical protein
MVDITVTPTLADAVSASLVHARVAKQNAAIAVDAAEDAASAAVQQIENVLQGPLAGDPAVRPKDVG